MNKTTHSLMDILVPPGNAWLCQLSPEKTELPRGARHPPLRG